MIYKDFDNNYERREILKHEIVCKDMTSRDPSVIHCNHIVMDKMNIYIYICISPNTIWGGRGVRLDKIFSKIGGSETET